ncbi:putative linker histone H1/H5, domain H15, winged helix-like DNA-binding domain superfamily [Helianthus annuus]|nr:putative linker histone H1/H5, domain H15, winged helix-like DNA-binding domain superfamily [Helianthus annuus]
MATVAATPTVKDVKVKKARKPSVPPQHPPYLEMIKDAIVSLKERTGSSSQAIGKFIEGKYKNLPANYKKLLATQLKKNAADGKLVKVKASFKLPPKADSAKPAAKPKAVKKAPAKKKAAAKKVATPKKAAAGKKGRK